MTTVTLDSIVRSALATRQYPFHYYLQFLHYGTQCLRELNMDVLQNTKTVKLPITPIGSAALPEDFVDIVRVGVPVGAYLQPYMEDKSINTMYNLDDSGDKIPYDDVAAYYPQLPFTRESIWFSTSINDKGEFRGRVYNNKPAYKNSFVLARDRGEIQLDPSLTPDYITLEYITDGLTCDCCTGVHPYAIMTIEKFMIWQMKEHSRAYGSQERQLAKMDYVAEYDRLQGRMNPIDIDDIRRSLRRGYSGTIKN